MENIFFFKGWAGMAWIEFFSSLDSSIHILSFLSSFFILQ
mgnify:CR=1 FL=1